MEESTRLAYRPAMRRSRPSTSVVRILPLIAAGLLAACSGDGGGTDVSAPPSEEPQPEPPPPSECGEGKSYESTFAAVQDIIFERHGCTQDICHGSSAQGGLVLTPEELLVRGAAGVVSVPWPQLSELTVQTSARWSPFVGTYPARALQLSTQEGQRMVIDEGFLGVPAEVVALLCRAYRGAEGAQAPE